MTTQAGHPLNLPWFVSGAMDAAEAETIRSHLALCGACREEADRLASLRASFVRHKGTSHIAAGDLVAYARGESDGDAATALRRHVEECEECRGDLAAARRGVVRRISPRWIAAAAILVALAGAVILWKPPSSPERMITFLPTRRDVALASTLPGRGPWNITVVLPLGAPEGIYHMRIERFDGAWATDTLPEAVRQEDGTVHTTIPPLPSPGRHRLMLTPAVPAPGSPYLYPFEVVERGNQP